MTQLSHQATGRLHAHINRTYPFRCVVMQCDEQGLWCIMCVFEMRTFEEADEAGLELCVDNDDPSVTAMHYYVGELT